MHDRVFQNIQEVRQHFRRNGFEAGLLVVTKLDGCFVTKKKKEQKGGGAKELNG